MDSRIQPPHGPGLHDGHDDLNEAVLGVVVFGTTPPSRFEAGDHVLGDDGLIFRQTVGILYNGQGGVNDQEPAVIKSGKLRQLGIDLARILVDQVVAGDQVVGQRPELALDLLNTDLDRPALIVVQDAVLEQDAGHHADQKYDNEKNDPEASQKSQLLQDRLDFSLHKLFP